MNYYEDFYVKSIIKGGSKNPFFKRRHFFKNDFLKIID